MAALNEPASAPADRAAWDEAYRRLTRFLGAYRIGDLAHQHGLIGAIFTEAKRRHAGDSSRPPVTVTLEIALEKVDTWFGQRLGLESALPPERRVSGGTVALLLCDGAQRWPEGFLSDAPPLDLIDRLRSASVKAGPDLSISRMVAREMDYGAFETAHETFRSFAWGPVARAFLLWSAIWIAAYLTWQERQ